MNIARKRKRETWATKISNPEDTLRRSIETLCHSGLNPPDPLLLKEIKKFCRESPALLETAHQCIMKLLSKEQAEVRLTAFQIINELFLRSHNFRVLVITDLELIMELVAGITESKKMPPPKKIASELKQLALLTVPKWKDEFGKSYKQLVVAYDYLLRTRNVDFEGARRVVEDEERQRAERDQKAREVKEQVLRELNNSFNDKQEEINTAIESLNNCLNLLLPTPDEFFVVPKKTDPEDIEPFNTSEPSTSDENDLRLFGIQSSYNLVIDFDPNKKVNIERTEENSAVIDNLKDLMKLAKKRLLPVFDKWQATIANISLLSDHEFVIKVSDLRIRLENLLKKSRGLRIDGGRESSDDESDMEEVVKEGYEPAVLPVICDPHPFYNSSISKPGPSNIRRDTKSVDSEIEVRNNSKETNVNPEKESSELKESSPKKAKLVTAADIQMELESGPSSSAGSSVPTFVSVRMDKWGSGDMEVDEVSLPDTLKTRVVDFHREFEPVTRTCRAPLPSGDLCPRMDRFKCPFHGRIVDRDKNGKCKNLEDEVKPSTSKEEPVPDWQEPALLAHLKAVTGIDLKMPEKKGGRNKKNRGPSATIADRVRQHNFPGVVDVNRLVDTPKARLKRKLFSKDTIVLNISSRRTNMKRQSSIALVVDEDTPLNEKLCGKYAKSFAYYTMKDRLPVILTKIVDQISRDKDEIVSNHGKESEEEIKTVIGRISKLKNEVQTDKPLLPIEVEASDAQIWNDYLQEMMVDGSPASWFSSPWLYTENYLYRRIFEIFQLSNTLKCFDPFKKQKEEAYEAAVNEFQSVTKALDSAGSSNVNKFTTAVKLSLWSNRCDLSLSNGEVDSQEDSALANIDALSKFIITDHTERAFQAIDRHPSRIIDIVHDNAAYELFVDLCLAEQLLSSGLADLIRLRIKTFPWYVSDVTLPDIEWLLRRMSSDGLGEISTRWRGYLDSGRWVIKADDFWTLPFPYSEMKKRDQTLYNSLAEASLVIFKGDLNYRKLVGDINWKCSTAFSEALQGFLPTNVLSLRTIKADVICNIPEEVAERITEIDPHWMRTGQYAVIQFAAKQ